MLSFHTYKKKNQIASQKNILIFAEKTQTIKMEKKKKIARPNNNSCFEENTSFFSFLLSSRVCSRWHHNMLGRFAFCEKKTG